MTSFGDPGRNRARGPLVYLVRSWPRLSQTFVLDEVIGLEQLGAAIRIVALARSDDELVQAELEQVRAPVDYLDGATSRQLLRAHAAAAATSPLGYLRAVWVTWRRPEWDAGYRVASRWQCLGLAVRLAGMLDSLGRRRPGEARFRAAPALHLHAHFAHDPAAVAFLTHLLTGVPWSFTAHARDLWQVPGSALTERVRSARFVVACTADGADHVRELLPARFRDRVRLVHHGVVVTTFRPAPREAGSRTPRIVSIGRLVEKKGFPDLLAACRLLADEGRNFRCTIFGEGPLEAELTDRIRRLGLSDVVTLAGPRTRRDLVSVLQQADLFALTPHVAADGDRDGIPNVVVEAMACGVPVVATAVGGIPEVVRHGINGLLAPAGDVPRITRHLATLLDDPGRRASLGEAARRTVLDAFDSREAARLLAEMFDATAEGRRRRDEAVIR